MLYAFDLIEQDGDDLRDLPLIERKQRLKKLIGKARHAILFTEHLIGDGAAMFRHVRHGAGGHCRSGRTRVSQRAVKNPTSDAVRREREEEWR